MSSNKTPGEQLRPHEFGTPLDAFLAVTAIGAAKVGEAIDDPAPKKVLLGVALVTGGAIVARLFRADTNPEAPSVEDLDVFGQK